MPLRLPGLSSPSLKTRITVFMLLVFFVGMRSIALCAARLLRHGAERLLGEARHARREEDVCTN